MMKGGIWVYLEQTNGVLENVALELVGKARDMARQSRQAVSGLLMGSSMAGTSEEALQYGLDEVLVADEPILGRYTTDAYAQAAFLALKQYQPDIFLLGATANGRDMAGRLAARLRTGLTADCVNLSLKEENEENLLVGEVTGFGGGIAALITCPKRRPQMATVRPGIFGMAAKGKFSHGLVRRLEISLESQEINVEILETRQDAGAVDITKAPYLVIGGRGTRGDFRLLKELAELVGGELAVTRVAVDEGWAPRELQIGQTGYAARPKVAFVCGASGALQFTVGLAEAGKIVAVNNDPEALIFENADYCVRGDLFEILPVLIEELKKCRQKTPV